MKKYLPYLFAATVLLPLGGCQDKNDESINANRTDNEITADGDIQRVVMRGASFIDESATKTSFNYTQGSGTQFLWGDNDVVGIFPDEGDQIGFAMTDGAGATEAVFSGGGWALKSSSTYYAYYPFSRDNFASADKRNDIRFDYTGQSQAGKTSVDLSAYTFMAAAGTTPSNGTISFNFANLNTLVVVDVTVPADGVYSRLDLITDADLFATSGKLDLAQSTLSVAPIAKSSTATLQLAGIEAVKDEVLRLYLMIAPVDLSAHTLSVKLTDAGGVTYLADVASKNFRAGYTSRIEAYPTLPGKTASVNVATAGTLSTLIADASSVENLTVTGDLNGTDIKFIRSMTALAYLNLKGANIVAGGTAYYQSCTTANNVVGNYMFYAKTKLISVILPDSATSVGTYAFSNCTRLESVTLGDNVTSVGNYAFNSCLELKSATLGNNVTSLPSYAFNTCAALTEVSLGNKLRTIGESTFYGCTSLATVTLPATLTSLGSSAFYNCESLTSINIPESVTSIGSYAFDGCTSLNAVYINSIEAWCNISFSRGSNPLYYAHNLYLNNTLVTALVIPEGVFSIRTYAFNGCSSLNAITIPEGVTSIGESAFSNCSSWASSITIPKKVTSIGYSAFSGCTSLTSINIPESVTSIGSYAFDGCTGEATINCTIPDAKSSYGAFYGNKFTTIIIGNGVTSIGGFAFSGCTSLTSITIPEGVTSIGSSAFSGCTSLTSITIPEGVTSISNDAFKNCTSLTSINIPEGVTSIGYCAFYGCTALSSITIPEGVTSIGSSAFSCCTSLASVYCKPTTVPAGGSYMFYINASGRKIYVPTASVDAYKAATDWKDYSSGIYGYDFE